MRYFDIEYVVEDGEAAWFEDALVRTTLLVARRVPDRGSALLGSGRGYILARLGSAAADARSLVGALDPESLCPEQSFAELLGHIAESRTPIRVPGLTATWVSDRHFRDQLEQHLDHVPWMAALEPRHNPPDGSCRTAPAHIPRQIRDELGQLEVPTVTLADYGWRVGQGLRTGANRFFYGESIGQDGDQTVLRVDPALAQTPLAISNCLLRTVVRKQGDLISANGHPNRSPGRLLDLSGHAVDTDMVDFMSSGVTAPYQALSRALTEHIRRAECLNVGTDDSPRFLPELSAVVTNVKVADPTHPGRLPRFWYQLPPLAPRHVPSLFIPRVNHGHPLACINDDGVIIDANFSTLWSDNEGALTPLSLLALMHSTWVLLAMEVSGTVLGGGALKLEATQLRRLPLPTLDVDDLRQLDALGLTLSLTKDTGNAVRRRIDAVVWPRICGDGADGHLARALDQLRADLLCRRNPRRGTGIGDA